MFGNKELIWFKLRAVVVFFVYTVEFKMQRFQF